ncbi:hypothetical protein [Streptomyces sp. TN58]|uniref:hypothetical protein n=1 Tax=Streptomyces sp. TN58 TaxID=234612 RepID=UPI0009504E59|nr:hypothetical protein [Streptomyces sp. TN58]APU41063.1 hypothetical protein BSL84_16150 [Streptomyces sp. TN58]
MSGNAPVDPAEVPVFTGNLAVLDEKVKAISSGGAAVSTKASDVHTSFGGLQAFYQAPEADQLFATSKPVSDLGLKLSSDMCTIAGALGTYSRDAAPVVKKLEKLKAEAQAFREKTDKDDKWREDGDLIDENLDRRNEIAEVWAEFQEVERAAYAKIVALVGGKPLRVNDGSNAKDMYGYDAEAMKQSKSLPWGDAVEESIPAWQVWEHAWEFGKGVIVDGVWGTLKGLGGLVGLQGWDVFKQSWTGLAKLGTGLAIMSIPGAGALFLSAPDDKLPSWLRDSRTAMKETGKALLAWDQWGSNPSRAAGAVTFNVVTTIFTGGAGGAAAGAGKAGAVAKTLSFAGKAGHAIDPMTYIFKGAGAGFSKIGDVMAGLKGMGKFEVPSIDVDGVVALPDGAVHLPDGAIHLPAGTAVPDGAIKLSDGTIKLPEGTTALPPGTVKLPVDGPPRFMDLEGNIYKADGTLDQSGTAARQEPSPDADAGVPRTEAPKTDTPSTARVPERELVGVGARGGDDAIRLGSDISDPVHAIDNTPRGVDATPVRVPEHELAGVGGRGGDHTPGGTAPDNMPRNELNQPGGPRPDSPTPTGATHGDTPGGTAGHGDGPGTGATHGDGPGGTGGTHPDPAGTGGSHTPTPPPAPLDDATRAANRAEYEAAREVPAKDRSAAEIAAIEREHVRLANEDPVWRAEHYDKWGPGKRNNAEELVDGQLLPKLLKQDGRWVAADSIPHAHPGGFHLTPLERGADTVPPAHLTHLNEVAAKRFAGMELNKWEKAFDENPTFENARELAYAQEHYNQTVGKGVSNNTKLGEDLGEEAARRHMLLQKEFEGSHEILDLPDTPNGSKRFDQLWRDKDGNLVIVEAKSPNGVLEWRQSNGRPDIVKVKQGSIDYIKTIVADMKERAFTSPDDARYAKEIEDALDNKTLRYVLVQANENAGQYAGAVLKYFKLF